MTPSECAEFDRLNPHLWARFCHVIDEARAAHRAKWSARAALYIVRWTAAVHINDHMSAWWARKWLATHPEAPDFFELRAAAADARPNPQMDLGF